jgi:small subunit ribosomal protein S21
MLIIEVKDGNLERALKAFKFKARRTKLIETLRGLEYFEKPSVKKRLQKQKAIYHQSKEKE